MSLPEQIDVKAVTDTQCITYPESYMLRRRIKQTNVGGNDTDKSQWGVAAVTHSDRFKTPGLDKGKPQAKKWDHLLTAESNLRSGCRLKAAAKHLAKPGLISLGGGLPSDCYFPISSIETTVPVPPHFSACSQPASTLPLNTGSSVSPSNPTTTSLTATKHDLILGTSIFDLRTALNYGQGTGSAQLLRWVTEHTELVHRPPYANWAVNLNIGSTSALDISLRMLCSRGDVLLVEKYTFSAVLETAAPMGVKVVGVDMDAEGLRPEKMDELLSAWDERKRCSKKPRVLYVIPTGQNPTGSTMSEERRRQVYSVCQKHDVYILEDEPYYFLQMPEYEPRSPIDEIESSEPTSETSSAVFPVAAEAAGTCNAESHARDAFLASLIPSLLSMDVDGRVLRMDSFSKIIAPGLRVGWVTACHQIIERYKYHVDVSTQGPAGISQVVLFKLLDEHWGHGGYLDWLEHLRKEYGMRRDNVLDACEKYLPRDVVSWAAPRAGMFHWLKIEWQKHPEANKRTVEELQEEIYNASVRHGSLVMPGNFFLAEQDREQTEMFFRATYAAAPVDQIQEAIRRFGAAVDECFARAGQC